MRNSQEMNQTAPAIQISKMHRKNAPKRSTVERRALANAGTKVERRDQCADEVDIEADAEVEISRRLCS
jgi:cobalamin biosynthesis protein CbiG